MNVVSSANFRSLTEGSLEVQSFVLRENSSGERTQPWGAPVLIVRVLDVSSPSLTSLSVRKLGIHWQMEVGTESCVSLFKGVRDDGVESGAEVHKQHACISPWFVQMLEEVLQSHVDCIIHKPVCSLGKLQGVQWCPSDNPKPVFQMISWPQMLGL